MMLKSDIIEMAKSVFVEEVDFLTLDEKAVVIDAFNEALSILQPVIDNAKEKGYVDAEGVE